MNSQTNDNKKKFHIHTLGCKVNQYESQAMRELLLKAGFEESGDDEIADVYIVNTCTVTGEADRESKSIMGRLHKENPNARIVATGCLVERGYADLLSVPGISNVLKNSEKNRIVRMVTGDEDDRWFSRPRLAELSISDFKGHSKAYVKIQDGCENRCSYCKVPLVRGKLISKSIKSIMAEVRDLARNGFREIVLTGICLGSWGKDLYLWRIAHGIKLKRLNIVNVLKALDKLDGDFRIRLSSIEPKYITDELIGFMASSKRMCKHLHIPFQSGDDDVLKLMNRPYTYSDYRSIINKVRAKIPDIALTTDMIVGFPGESHAMFRNSMAFAKKAAPARAHIFTFSRREGTPAYDMADNVDRAVIKNRYMKMSAIAIEAAYEYKRSFLGRELKVLAETKRDSKTGLLKGYSDNYIQVLFAGPDDLMRKIVPVKVVGFDSGKAMGVYVR